MPIEKLEEFARDGQKNTDELVLTDGFPRPKFPARQWFNYLFNMLSLKINELIELDPISKTEIVDNLTTNNATKVASAKTVKELQDNKLDKSALNNTLTSISTTQALTAAQGKVLNDSLNVLNYCPIAYPKNMPPTGYLALMRQAISQATYPILYALYGATLPDLRAYSIRGLDNGRGIDINRIILSNQEDAIRNIEGSVSMDDGAVISSKGVFYDGGSTTTAGALNDQVGRKLMFDASRVVPTANENRVKNIAFLYILKAG